MSIGIFTCQSATEIFFFSNPFFGCCHYGKAVPSLKRARFTKVDLFTVKDDKFKSEPFLREVKAIYTDLINRHISDLEQQLKVFDKNSVYLPTKKIGMNNPKAAEIKADNTARQEWNRTADMAQRF